MRGRARFLLAGLASATLAQCGEGGAPWDATPYWEQGEVDFGRPVYLLAEEDWADPARVDALADRLEQGDLSEVIRSAVREKLATALDGTGLTAEDVEIELLDAIPADVAIGGNGSSAGSGRGRIEWPVHPQPAEGYRLRLRIAYAVDRLPELHAPPPRDAGIREQDRRERDRATLHAYAYMQWAGGPGERGFHARAKGVGEAVVEAVRAHVRDAARDAGFDPVYEYPFARPPAATAGD